jgi:hypothetical protein
MTIKEIREKLEQWKADDIYKSSKSYKEYKSNMVAGEFFYVLSWRLSLNFIGIPEPIVQNKKFHTQTLAIEPLSDNPDADLHRLNRLLPAFDDEFLQKVDAAYGMRIEELNPPGFF